MYRKYSTLLLLSFALLAAAEYKLVWSDEFNGNKLNTANWMYEVDCIGGGNNELQCYTSRESNIHVANGNLYITAIPENYNGRQYTSGRINSRPAGSWKYGKFEIRAKLPKGDYLWPALWMLPRDKAYGEWAASGEIDIMEARGQNNFEMESTIHYGGTQPNNANSGSGPRRFDSDLTADFHVYSCIWDRDQIQFAVDGKVFFVQNLVRSFYSGRGSNPYNDLRQPFDKPFFFLFNVAIGGGFFGANSHALTQDIARRWTSPSMVVDYVRVYQDNGVVINPPIPVPSPVPSSAAQPKDSVSIGESIGVTSKEYSAISTAATSAKSSAASSARTTFTYANAPKTTGASQNAPATTSSDSNACPSGCGAGSCCKDANLGGVCYNPNTYHCAADSQGALHLCSKGAGYCQRGGCYDTAFYKCVNGGLAPL